MKIAVIGSGISGNLVARMLASKYEVHVFEANRYPGGHSNTVDFEVFGRQCSADTGFMVFNTRTYPNFTRLLQHLSIDSQPSDMSFSVKCRRTGLEYQGSSLNGLFAQRLNLLRPRFHRMLLDIARFNRLALHAVNTGELDDGTTVGEFLDRRRLRASFYDHYLVPMVAAIWSADPPSILDFPAKFLVGFMKNHGLLQLTDRPQWQTVAGGARNYVETLMAPIRDRVHLNSAVRSVRRRDDDVEIELVAGRVERFDIVVCAAHADQTLAMLADATPVEKSVLAAFPYQENQAVLHTDTSWLPRRKRAWASWNYHVTGVDNRPATVTYDLSRLQRLDTPSPVLLSLNPTEQIFPESTIRTLTYHHPAYSRASIAAQQRIEEINGVRRTYFCGAYWGYGFHEDGVNSALAVAKHFDLELDSCIAASTREEFPTVATCR